MPGYEIAVSAFVVLFSALVLVTEMMRRQVHQGRYGNQQVSPFDRRFVNDLLGEGGIWKSHKQLYPRSGLRSCFWAVMVALLICVMIGVFLYVQRSA